MVRAVGRVVETPVDGGKLPPDIAAFVRDVTEDRYRHAIVASEVHILDGPNEF